MAGASGTFMQRRVIKDALPSLVKFLDKQSQVSIKTGPLYSQSQTFKLQLTVLRSLGILCRQLEISDTNLSPAVWVCCQYLSARQPKELQEVGNKRGDFDLPHVSLFFGQDTSSALVMHGTEAFLKITCLIYPRQLAA